MKINKHNFFKNTYGRFRCIKKLPANVIKLDSDSKESSYYIREDEETLYRVSNHWALSECLFVASCVWILLDTKGHQNVNKKRIGMIKFKNLKSTENLKLSKRVSYYSGREIIEETDENLKTMEKVLNSRMSKR